MSNRRTMAEAKALVGRYQKSGLSVKVFCREEGIKPVTLYYWLKRFRSLPDQEASSLVPVCLEGMGAGFGAGQRQGIDLVYPNGVRLLVPEGSDLQLLRELVLLYR